MDARSTSPSSKIYSQVLITVQTRLKPSTPLDRFQQAWLLRSCMLSGKHSYRLWSRAHHSWVAEGSRRTELAFAPGQMQTHLSFSPAIPCAPVSAKVSKACDTVLLHRHSYTITSLRYMREQCILYCFWVILPKKQNLKMSGSTEKIEVSGQTSVSSVETADMLL